MKVFVVKISRIEQNPRKPQNFHPSKLIRYTVYLWLHYNYEYSYNTTVPYINCNYIIVTISAKTVSNGTTTEIQFIIKATL